MSRATDRVRAEIGHRRALGSHTSMTGTSATGRAPGRGSSAPGQRHQP